MDLKLYMTYSCPFCIKVLNFMNEHNISVPLIDLATDAQHRKNLITIGGKGQVPCLLINNTPLYESDLIIDWLRTNAS